MEDKEILSALKKLCDYAYEQGYHEMGYDPVREIARKLKEAKRPTQPKPKGGQSHDDKNDRTAHAGAMES